MVQLKSSSSVQYSSFYNRFDNPGKLHLQWSGGFHAGPGNRQGEVVMITPCLSVQAICTRD